VATVLGVKQVYPGRYLPGSLLELKQKEKVTFSHCVPTILHMLLNHPDASKTDLKGWKMIIGGAAFPRVLCEKALEAGMDVFTGYGMSETCPILTITHLSEANFKKSNPEKAELLCKTGRPLPLVQIKHVDENLVEQAWDASTSGELVVRSPWLTQGYLKDHRTSEQLWSGGWLHTGDVAHRDAEGYIKITDRSKDVIKVSGEWVSSLELEDIIAQHPVVSEVAVIAESHSKWGEIPLALIVPKPGHEELTERDFLKFLRSYSDKGLAPAQIGLTRLQFVEAIERTSVGKVNKVAMRQKYL
jgi:fatty-acyl-CoA synthase